MDPAVLWTAIGVMVGGVAIVIGWFQWNATRGRVRVKVDYGKYSVSVRIDSQTPNEVVVNRLSILGARHPLLSRIRTLALGRPMPRKYAFSKFHADSFWIDMLIHGDRFEDMDTSKSFPLAPYSTLWWGYSVSGHKQHEVRSPDARLKQTLKDPRVKLRGYADVSGHPTRVTVSRWQRQKHY